MKYRVLKKGIEHAIQIKKWYGWSNYLVYSDTCVGPSWLIPIQWYKTPLEELIEIMKFNFSDKAEFQVIEESKL
jgi:hypothetical protein